MILTELQQAKEGICFRLRETRRARGLTQMKLAALAGTTQAVIQKIENGKSRQPRIMEDLAIALEVNPAWLQ
jgi:transcriptional regulator with XRE-family HTH domain